MSTITEYQVLSYKGIPQELTEQVNKLLNDGWSVRGHLQTSVTDLGLIYTQVMVKEKTFAEQLEEAQEIIKTVKETDL